MLERCDWLQAAVSLGLAAVVTAFAVIRATRGVVGGSATAGMLYGLSWPIAFTTLFLFEGALSKAGASDEVLGLVASAGPAMLVGVIYLVGAAVWRSAVMFALGAWLCLVWQWGPISGFPASLPTGPAGEPQSRSPWAAVRHDRNTGRHCRICWTAHGPTIPPEIDEAIVEVQSFLHLDSYLRRML
ncbi:MAG: hypothetical protein WKF73_14475 [Nocardioidaceae bacterium]